MQNHEPMHRYTFDDPNTPQETEKLIQTIILERLLRLYEKKYYAEQMEEQVHP